MSAGPGGGGQAATGQAATGQAGGGASSAVIDQAMTATEGTRTVARWIASSLGAVPSLTVLAAIIRAPGDYGFDGGRLTAGVLLAAGGALIGVLAFAWVALPVYLEDSKLKDLDLRRIPGQPYSRFDQFSEVLERLRTAAAQAEYEATAALAEADGAGAAARQLDAAAKTAEGEADAAPLDAGLRAAATAPRARADQAAAQAAAKASAAAVAASASSMWQTQIARRDSIRMDAYQLKASDVVRVRFMVACGAAVLAVGLIAVGVVEIGLAPNTKPGAGPAPVSLVTLQLTKAGQDALKCNLATLKALRTGGTAAAPTVITFPVPGCPSQTVVFTTTSQTPLGKVSAAPPAGG